MLSGFTGRRFEVEGVLYARNSGVLAEELIEPCDTNDLLFYREYKDKHALANRHGVDYTVYIVRTFATENENV